MRNDTGWIVELPGTTQDVLTEVLRAGAQKLLTEAIEEEVAAYIASHAPERDEKGQRLVVRNGHLPEREIQTGIGPVRVRQPRVNDRRTGEQGRRIRFTSSILPRYLRKTKSLEGLLPWLYLKGVSSGDFSEALEALVGPSAKGLSATTVMRLKEVWRQEWVRWSRRSLEGKRYVYFWADGVYFNIRLEGERACILVVMGATVEGKKELVAIGDGYRESEASWKDLLRDLKERGLERGPELAVGDGGLGFWKAVRQVYPETREQRCWVHKTGNVLNYLPKSQQSMAKRKLQEIWMAETRATAERAFEAFVARYGTKYARAAECLAKDRETLLTFYDFPAEHWVHLRTTNPLESTFATVRLRTVRTKGCGSRMACLTMVFKLAESAERHWSPLNGRPLLVDVIEGVRFVDGIKEKAA